MARSNARSYDPLVDVRKFSPLPLNSHLLMAIKPSSRTNSKHPN